MNQTSTQTDHLNSLHLSHEQLCDHLLTSASSDSPAALPEINHTTLCGETAKLHLVSPPVSQSVSEPVVLCNADAVENHLRSCTTCTAELTSLRDMLSDFRIASTTFAAAEFESITGNRAATDSAQRILSLAARSSRPAAARPLIWAIAAMLLVGATITPLKLHHSAQRPAAAVSQTAPTGESDEALLEEVDQTLSTDVPSAMKPLSDPLADQNSNQTTGKNIDHE